MFILPTGPDNPQPCPFGKVSKPVPSTSKPCNQFH